MKKRRTSNLLLFSALTVISCTTVKAFDDSKNSKNTELAGVIWNSRKVNEVDPTLGYQNLRYQTPRQQAALAELKKNPATPQRQHAETCQQKTQEETDDQSFWLKQYQSSFIQHNSIRRISFFSQFLLHLSSQDDFGIEDFDD